MRFDWEVMYQGKVYNIAALPIGTDTDLVRGVWCYLSIVEQCSARGAFQCGVAKIHSRSITDALFLRCLKAYKYPKLDKASPKSKAKRLQKYSDAVFLNALRSSKSDATKR
jgi:hypothetical protein